jgi:uncharacterized membrane protein YbhN (UPF0104 family)
MRPNTKNIILTVLIGLAVWGLGFTVIYFVTFGQLPPGNFLRIFLSIIVTFPIAVVLGLSCFCWLRTRHLRDNELYEDIENQ